MKIYGRLASCLTEKEFQKMMTMEASKSGSDSFGETDK